MQNGNTEKTVLKLDISQLTALLSQKKISAVELMRSYWDQIEHWNPKIKAYITLNERALQQAERVDQARMRGEKMGRLAGIPMAVKDMFCTESLATTAGSRILHNFVPPYSATAVERLQSEGALIVGKANQDEFAMGSSTETSHFGKCLNPWNLDYVPGGSSGGSAAAVAAGFAAFSLGTDTGGSIRQPANFCNLVGIKPTYGRISRYGIVAFASSLDQAGPMARTVADATLALEIMSGRDPKDATTSDQKVPAWTQNLKADLKGMKVGLPKEYFAEKLHPDVEKTVQNAINWVKAAGAETIEVSLPLVSMSVPIYYLVCTSEASSNLSRYDGVRYGHRADFNHKPAKDLEEFYSRSRGEGFGEEVKRRIMLGTHALSSGYYDAYYKKACQVRRLLRDQYVQAFQKCDVLLSPVTTTPAFKMGERIEDPLSMYLNDIYTTSTNLAGLPGMSVPAGFTQDGLPIGVQLTAGHFEEQKMLNAALAIEQAAQVVGRLPNVIQ